MENIKGMYVDKNKGELSISNHNLVKAWFNIGEEKSTWKNESYETIEWYKKDLDSMKKNGRRPNTHDRNIGFGDFMRKIKISQEGKLKVKKRIKVGKKGDTRILAAEWVDKKLKDNIKKEEDSVEDGE